MLASEHNRVREQTNAQLQGFYGLVYDKIAGLAVVHEDKDFVASFTNEMLKIAKVFQSKAVEFKKVSRRPSGDATFLSPVDAPVSSVTMDRFPASVSNGAQARTSKEGRP